jgi:transposase
MNEDKTDEKKPQALPARRSRSGKYSQRWDTYNKAQVNEKRHFLLLLGELSKSAEEPERGPGRPPLPLSDMIFCSVYKTYLLLSSRRAMTDFEEAHKKALITKVPHFNAVSDFLNEESVTPFLERLIEQSSYPLASVESDFAADATGLSTCVRRRWYNRHRRRYQVRRDWIGLHIICGVRTNVITCARAGGCREDENEHFEEMLRRTARRFDVAEVSADAGYLSNKNLRQVVLLGATPYINFKSNSTTDGVLMNALWKAMLNAYRHRREEFAKHYYKRNNVETTFSMLKAKFGDRLSSKSLRAQINEALCKALCHNLCVLIQSMYELGVDPYAFKAPPSRSSVAEARLMGCAHGDAEYDLVREKIPPADDYGRAAAKGRRWRSRVARPEPGSAALGDGPIQPLLPLFT